VEDRSGIPGQPLELLQGQRGLPAVLGTRMKDRNLHETRASRLNRRAHQDFPSGYLPQKHFLLSYISPIWLV
jgi:hypothetical protein